MFYINLVNCDLLQNYISEFSCDIGNLCFKYQLYDTKIIHESWFLCYLNLLCAPYESYLFYDYFSIGLTDFFYVSINNTYNCSVPGILNWFILSNGLKQKACIIDTVRCLGISKVGHKFFSFNNQ